MRMRWFLGLAIVALAIWLVIAAVIFWFGQEPRDPGLVIGTVVMALGVALAIALRRGLRRNTGALPGNRSQRRHQRQAEADGRPARYRRPPGRRTGFKAQSGRWDRDGPGDGSRR